MEQPLAEMNEVDLAFLACHDALRLGFRQSFFPAFHACYLQLAAAFRQSFFPAFHACYLESSVVVQLSLPPRFVALAFEIGLCQHLEFLHSTTCQRMLLQGRR